MIFEKQNYQQNCVENIIELLQNYDFKAHDAANLKEKNADLNTDFSFYELSDKPQIIGEGNDLKLTKRRDLAPLDLARNLAMQAGVFLDEPLECVVKNALFRAKNSLFIAKCNDSVLEVVKNDKESQVYLDAYECDDSDFEAFLNILANANERLNVVY